jgi:hypothetical protein
MIAPRPGPRGRFVALALALFGPLLFAGSARAALSHDSNLAWRTLHSRHFAVHYHDGAEARAREAIAIAEQVHARLSALFRWTPEEPTEIVLTDEYDVSNGYTTFFPANRMAIYLAPPDDLNSLEDHGGWLETVITHEYTHALHLDKARGLPRALRRGFGRFPLLFPNVFEPLWLLEGIATYYETDLARGMGRGQSSYFDMLMRMEVAGGSKPLRQVNQEVDTWPGGYVPYLYGVQFYRFAAGRYGEDKVQRWVENYSDNIIPFRILSNSRQTFGRDLVRVWDEFERDRREHYRAQLEAIRAVGVHEGERLTHNGYLAGHTRATTDGSVYYTAFDGRNDPTLLVLRPGAKEPEALAGLHFDARLDAHDTAGILVAQPEVCRNTRYYYDLYRVDARSGSTRRLTDCARYRSAAWSAAGDRIAAVHHELGASRLDLLDADGGFIETLWTGEGDAVIGDLDWSPDGASLVAALWRNGSGWNLELFSLAERRWRALTNDSAIDVQPQFTRDGSAVFFSSDHGGIYNLRRLVLASGEIVTLSNVAGGAFHPAEAADRTLYYIGYTPQGFDLHRLEPQRRATPTAAPGPSVMAATPAPVPQDLQTGDYATLSGLWPRWWLPHLVVEPGRAEIGAVTSGSDALGRHVYAVDAAYDFANNLGVGALDYVYDRWYPVLKLHAARAHSFEREDNDDQDVTRVRRADTGQAEVVLPWLRHDWRWSLHFAALTERESDARLRRDAAPKPERDDSMVGTALVFDSTRRYPLSVSRSHGRELRLVAENSDAFDGDYMGRIYTLDWREFVALGAEHVLALRFVEGYGTEQPRPFGLGGSHGAPAAPPLLGSTLLDSPFNLRRYALRGYPEGLEELEGRRMRLGSIEYRFPVKRIERGIMTPPMAIHQAYGGVFVDAGAAWNEGRSPQDYRVGAGVETSADVALFYSLRFQLRLGLAHGFDEDGENQVYLRVGSSF